MTSDTGTSRRQILKDTTHYLLSTILSQTVGLFRTIILPVLLGPSQLGVWNLMNVIIGYGANAHLGLLYGLNKMVPALRGLGRFRDIDELKDSVFWFNLLLGLIGGVALFLASFLIQPIYASASRIIALVVVLQMVFVYLFCLLRADNHFEIVSKGVFLFSFFSALLVVLFAYFFPDRLLGALVGLTIAHVIVLLFWFKKSNYRFAFSIKWPNITQAFEIGIPLIVVSLIDMVLLSLDRWVIAWQLPETALGFYALGIMACNLLGLIPTAAANVLYPRMLERFAISQDFGMISGLFLNPVRMMAIAMVFLISAATIILPLIIELFLPQYISSLSIITILVPGAYFLAMAPIAGSFLITVNRQRSMIIIQLIAMSIGLFVDILLLYSGFGISGVAYGTIFCYAIYGLGYVGIAVYLVEGKWMASLIYLAQLSALFIFMIAALQLAHIVIRGDTAWTSQIYLAAARVFAVFCMLAPFVWLINRHNDLLSTVWNEIENWWAARKTDK